jgi:hypothetical protein
MKIHTLLLALPLVFAAACGDDNPAGQDGPSAIDAPLVDAAPDASCFTNPTTHNEIINACTTAQKIFKDSHPPLLNPDGSLPPLP